MNRSRDTFAWGVFLVITGTLFLISSLSSYSLEVLWPLFPLAIGVAFIIKYFFNRKSSSGLMPGFTLVVIALLLFYCNTYGWDRMEMLWPVFIIAPSAGFFALYFLGNRERSHLVSGIVLFVIGLLFLVANSEMGQYWPVILIIVGILLIASNWKVKVNENK